MGKRKMKINYSQIEDFLEVELSQDRIKSWRKLTAGQYRINEALDIYPRRKKMHWVETGERGTYQNLERLIDLLF